jgi:hypothetical protein
MAEMETLCCIVVVVVVVVVMFRIDLARLWNADELRCGA